MSEAKLKVEGLVNVNGVSRGAIYELPEEEARRLIRRGYAAPWRDIPPAPSPDQIKQSNANKAKSNAKTKNQSTGNASQVKPKTKSKSTTPKDDNPNGSPDGKPVIPEGQGGDEAGQRQAAETEPVETQSAENDSGEIDE